MQNRRVAFVAGGMGGLGAAISRRLHAAGLAVTVSQEHSDHVETGLVVECDAGRTFHAFEVDVADFESGLQCGATYMSRRDLVCKAAAVDGSWGICWLDLRRAHSAGDVPARTSEARQGPAPDTYVLTT